MDQKGLFDEQEGGATPGGDDLLEVKETKKVSKKSNTTLLVGVGVLLIVVAVGAKFFLSGEEEPVPPPAPARIPIKEATVAANVTGDNAVPAKEDVKPAVEPKKEEVKAKIEVVPEAAGKEGPGIIVGTYAAKYEVETAKTKLNKIPHNVKETKQKVMMNRILAKEVKDKDEANVVVSGLKENGYEPFVVRKNDLYKIYAVSNFDETIARANKEDLEKLGYLPVIEKGEAKVKVYQVIAGSKSEENAKALMQSLKKMGFKPEILK